LDPKKAGPYDHFARVTSLGTLHISSGGSSERKGGLNTSVLSPAEIVGLGKMLEVKLRAQVQALRVKCEQTGNDRSVEDDIRQTYRWFAGQLRDLLAGGGK
jgi:hypothetical protein